MREWGPLLVAGLLPCVLALHPNDSCHAQSAPPAAGPQFVDATKAAGIDFTHFKGHQGIAINLEQFGPGVCVADFDGDGWLDIYFVNGRDRYNRGISVRNALYRNDGDGTFTDVTDNASVPGTGYGLGCVWGDYDNDGHPDLFVTQYRAQCPLPLQCQWNICRRHGQGGRGRTGIREVPQCRDLRRS